MQTGDGARMKEVASRSSLESPPPTKFLGSDDSEMEVWLWVTNESTVSNSCALDLSVEDISATEKYLR